MEILNIIQGDIIREVTSGGVMIVFMGILGFGLMLTGLESKVSGSGGVALIGATAVVCSIILGMVFGLTAETDQKTPIRYEVKINNPDYVIDATKYRFIEKRGEIVILEEVKQ